MEHAAELTMVLPEPSEREALQVLAAGSRSFSFAGWFLPADRRADAALLYAFCRHVDDVADEADDAERAASGLDALEDQLRSGRATSPFMASILELFARREMSVEPAIELIRGVRSDLGEVRVADDKELLTYCYRVAGVVGLMMCGVLGVKHPAAAPFAIDLGVAMQLTNISRDVGEDATLGRVYLPATRLSAVGVRPTPDGLRAAPHEVGQVVHDLLSLADRYYESAAEGMRFIPWRARLAIRVASRVYRAIGVRLRRLGCDPLSGRTVVPTWEKLGWAGLAVLAQLAPRGASRPHRASLHRALAGLPGVHTKDGE
jgi:phytoene synthase